METIFAKTFSSRRLLLTRWRFGVAPAEGYDGLANLLQRNSSTSSLDLDAHSSWANSDDQVTVDKPLLKPVESY